MKNNLKVEQFHNKNQFLIKEGNKLIFQSYNSTIAILENGVLTLGKHWDYSNTTSKHLYKFIEDYISNNKIEEVNNKTNKRKYINKLIDKGVITYDNQLV